MTDMTTTTWDVSERRVHLLAGTGCELSVEPHRARQIAMDLMYAASCCVQGVQPPEAHHLPTKYERVHN